MQVVKVFDVVVVCMGFCDYEVIVVGFVLYSYIVIVDDYKWYYLGVMFISICIIGDINDGCLFGVQFVGICGVEIFKCVDIYVMFLYYGMIVVVMSDFDFFYMFLFGLLWDVVQVVIQVWECVMCLLVLVV